ncbi:MAG: hypothetical protein J6X58_04810 [Bacteroidales bacterium]|nr:hypothetical protein [Bacteroidales bacterium]
MKKAAIVIFVFSLLAVSCGKTCRCYRYDGNVEEFDLEELEAQGTSCSYLENTNFGLTYSLCEKVIK